MSKPVSLYLAPMEGVGDAPFRRAMAALGGFDHACTEFLRVSRSPHIPSIVKKYDPFETDPIPQAAQIMGEDPTHMAETAVALAERGAPRVDLNCGCPSNTVTGRGAGSSLLRTPQRLFEIAQAMVEACPVPVSVKIRSGYEDISLFDEILDAVQASGAVLLTLHPRTKVEAYGPPARWELIARAKERLSIPVVGSGDILTSEDASRMCRETGCDGIMIGRGAIANPWIFQEIRTGQPCPPWALETFLRTYHRHSAHVTPKYQVGRLKALARYLLPDHPDLLRIRTTDSNLFLETFLIRLLENKTRRVYNSCISKEKHRCVHELRSKPIRPRVTRLSAAVGVST